MAEDLGLAHVVPTRWWHRLADGRAQCDLCPRACQLREGQRGFCFVRACQDGEVVLTTYGRASGFCVDPIEKKPLYHFLPGTAVLSFGTAGCNLGCRFCQNWDISKSRETDTLNDEAPPERIARAAKDLGCASVAFTYNDPVVWHEYAVDTAKACRELGIRTVAVTAGEVCPEPRADFYRWMDAANVDLKAFTERFYRSVCGVELAPVLDTLQWIARKTNVWLEVTTLLIPGENDGDDEIDAMTLWGVEHLGADVPWHFTAFHPDWRMRDVRPTPLSTLRRARAIALRNGLRHVYTGNVRDEDGSGTTCAGCGTTLVARDGYAITGWCLDEAGACQECGSRCPGVFAGPPGTWGERRLPVRLSRWA